MTLKEKLILSALALIEKEGMAGFTIRNVAKGCGVSCAAPYKHFRDKEELFLAVLDYVKLKWQERIDEITRDFDGDIKEQLVLLCMKYISFVAENPHFRAVIMLRDDNMTTEQRRRKNELSAYSRELASKWCIRAGYTHEQTERKTFIVRSFIYGANSLIDNGELKYSEENLAMIEKCIRREFLLD